MTDRILDFSHGKALLRVRHEQLVVQRDGEPDVTAPLEEVAAVVLAHPQVTTTQPVLSALMEKGGALVVCDAASMPCGMMLPLRGNMVQTERFAAQANAKLPLKKRLWQQVVKAKIRRQGDLLTTLHGEDWGLFEIAKTVRSGDPNNREAFAAQRYWSALFGEHGFRRKFDAPDQNRLLNYGYAVLRAVIGRAICAAGLHPSLGLHHHNRYNAFCLADDLMEPYRPLVDAVVVEEVGARGTDAPLDREGKQRLLRPILGRHRVDGESRLLFDLAARTAVSLSHSYINASPSLIYPKTWENAE